MVGKRSRARSNHSSRSGCQDHGGSRVFEFPARRLKSTDAQGYADRHRRLRHPSPRNFFAKVTAPAPSSTGSAARYGVSHGQFTKWFAATSFADQEAARYLGLSRRTMEKHRCYGTGPTYRKLGGRVVYALDDLNSWQIRGCAARPPIRAGAWCIPPDASTTTHRNPAPPLRASIGTTLHD